MTLTPEQLDQAKLQLAIAVREHKEYIDWQMSLTEEELTIELAKKIKPPPFIFKLS